MTIPTAGVTFETNLRMRVGLGVQGYLGVCDAPVYGQFEDYSIVVNHSEDEEEVDPPVAVFSASFPTRCAGVDMNFYDGSIGDVDSYEWVITDGVMTYTSNDQNPVITMDVAGVYDVTLTVTNVGGSDVETKEDEITINESSLVDITVTEISCVDAGDAQIAFNNPGSDTTYEYSTMIMGMDKGSNSVFTNLSPGIYYPVVYGANGCSSAGDEITIDYAEDIIPGFDLFEICQGESIDVFGNSVDTNGVFEQMFQTANGCDSMHTIEVYVLPIPDVSYDDSDTLEVTYGKMTIPEGVPSGGSFSGLGVSNGEFDPSVAGEGSHEVVYTYVDDITGCSGEALYTFVVTPSTVGMKDYCFLFIVKPYFERVS